MFSQVIIDTLSFNDNVNYLISSFSGLEIPPTRVITYNLAGENFGSYVSAFYGKRRWSLQGWVIGSSVSDFIAKRDAFQSALDIINGQITIKFNLSNGRSLQIDGVLTALTFVPGLGDPVASQFYVEFESAFPYFVSQNGTSATLGLPTGGGGKVPPDTMPMALGGNSGGSVTAANNGNALSYPTARISGPAINPSIRNSTLVKEIRFAITLAAGEYIDIDFKNKTIIDQAGTNRYSIKSGDWFYLIPGNNDIRFFADVYNASSQLTVTYKDSYLGI